MKKLILFLSFFLLLAHSSTASAAYFSMYDKPYLSIKYLNVIARPISTLNSTLDYDEKTLTWGYLPSFAVAAGYSFGMQPVRIEAELSGMSVFSDVKGANLDGASEIHDFKSTSFLIGSTINLYLEHNFTDAISVYTGGGVGIVMPFLYVRSDSSSLKRMSPSVPAYQWNLTIGTSIKINRSLFFDFGYRYVNIPAGIPTATLQTSTSGSAEIAKGSTRAKFDMSQINLGVRRLF